MTNYDVFARYYDEIMGDRAETAALVQIFITRYQSKAKSILELACGTGTVLQHFAHKYEVYGLDISSGMLSHAEKNVPVGKFSQQSMTKFQFDCKFDVIYCVYDSINHLLNFSDWQKTFQRAYDHLNQGGVLIFDMNTEAKLKRVASQPPQVHQFDKNYCIMEVQRVGQEIYSWFIKIFEHMDKNQYTLYEDGAQEKAFPLLRVKTALQKFRKVNVVDVRRKRPSAKSDRLFFICRK